MKYQIAGLTDAQVNESREKFGSNELTPYKTESFWHKLAENFKNPIIIILCVALVIMFVLSLFQLTQWYEAIAIAIAVALATLVSTLSEFKNESSFQKLQEEAARIKNLVFRNDELIEIPVSSIVKGDFVFLQPGDKIPADGKLVEGELKVGQASLTGESDSVTKRVPSDDMEEEQDFSSPYYLFKGSVVDEGEAVLKVDTVGDRTFYGQLAKDLSESDDRLTPLQVKLKGLATLISRFGYWAAIVIIVVFLFNKVFILNDFDGARIVAYVTNLETFLPDVLDVLVLSIIIVVAAIPEGLPMMIAIVLSLNMRKLLREKVLVRRLLGIETAGSLNILFSDKTGTITKGQLEAWEFVTTAGKEYNEYTSIPHPLRLLLGFSILENSSSYVSSDGDVVGGNVTERAMVSFINKDDLGEINSFNAKTVKQILFTSQRKFSACQVKTDAPLPLVNTDQITLFKGAPEIILEQCIYYFDEAGNKLPYERQNGLVDEIEKMADSGIRLIAVGVTEEPLESDDSLPNDAILLGIIGIRDEIRQESRWSIEEVQRAGIQVVMITGDRKGTAISIASEVGLLKDEDDVVLVSSELKQKDDEELTRLIPNMRVISRALPTDKSRLVRLSKRAGKVVGMTGDGVNDSAALNQADLGIAMGSGSEVSKEAGDIVILDDNFHSISNAIRYGRTIFKSIRKFVTFQLTVNVAAVLTVFLGPLIGIDFPLTIIQILWINIIMDTLAAIAFGGEPALHRYMDEPPVDRHEHILTKDMLSSIFTSGLYITAFSVFFLTYDPLKEFFIRNGAPDIQVFMTAFFNLFIFMIILNGFNVRTEKMNLLEHINENKKFILIMGLIFVLQISFTYIGGNILRTTALNLQEWIMIFTFALLIIPVDLCRKMIVKLIRVKEVDNVAAVQYSDDKTLAA